MADTKSLPTLIRLAEWHLEEKQRALREVEDRRDAVKRERVELALELDGELEYLNGSSETVRHFATVGSVYVTRMRQRVDDLLQKVAGLDTEVEAARTDLLEAFAEKKRLELVREKRDAQDRAERERREAEKLDEQGVNSWMRNGRASN